MLRPEAFLIHPETNPDNLVTGAPSFLLASFTGLWTHLVPGSWWYLWPGVFGSCSQHRDGWTKLQMGKGAETNHEARMDKALDVSYWEARLLPLDGGGWS